MADPILYRKLRKRHPGVDVEYMRDCRALYAGGQRLFGDDAVLSRLLPRNLPSELPEVYARRCADAAYISYPGAIIDTIVAELFAERLSMGADQEPDEFYAKWFEDVSPPGGERMSFSDLCKAQVRNALVFGRAWTKVDLPARPQFAEDEEPKSRNDEEKLGLAGVYAHPIDPECVIDWEDGTDGDLKWVLLCFQSRGREDLQSDRGEICEDYWFYTSTEWTRYQVKYTEDKPPSENLQVAPLESGAHSFGRVPVIPLVLPDGLWAMGKLERLARAHLNKFSALLWAENKSLYQQLVTIDGPPDESASSDGDSKKVVRQVFGVGRIIQLPHGADMKYVGPDPAAYSAAHTTLQMIKDELYRCVHHMAMSVDNSAASMRRSAESKVVDRADTTTVLKALAQIISEHAVVVCNTAVAGRKDESVEWTATGMQDFEATPLGSLLNDATLLSALDIPSPTFHKMANMRLVKTYLGEDATDEDLNIIAGEMDKAISAESLRPPPMPPSDTGLPEDGEEDDTSEDADKNQATVTAKSKRNKLPASVEKRAKGE
jgi:hypothetical protein